MPKSVMGIWSPVDKENNLETEKKEDIFTWIVMHTIVYSLKYQIKKHLISPPEINKKIIVLANVY